MRFTTRPELSGSFGMVASTPWLASAAGMGVLERGGNAFDAAVAAGLTLQVVEPHLNGPGGDAPILLYDAARREPVVVCGQGPAPAGATIALYRDELGLDLVPGTGLLAACVPGAFDAWLLILRDFGTVGLEDVLRFPIHYAERGFPMLPRIAETIAQVEALFREEWTTSAEIWLDRDRAPAPGGMWRTPLLAETYKRILAEGRMASRDRETQIDAARGAFLRGFVAEAIDSYCASTEVLDSSGRRHRGVLTAEDMASFAATTEAPVSIEHRGLTVCKAGPWSQGPVQLQALRLLDGFDLEGMGHLSGEYVHTVVEAMKLAFADREAWYGDPAFVDVPLETLLSRAYADERRALIGDEASLELRPGSPDGRTPALADIPDVEDLGAALGVGEPTVPREDQPVAGDTCHVDVADRLGNLVSATPSGGWLHSSPAIPGLGLCLGTRAQMFWLEEGLPPPPPAGARPPPTGARELARAGQAPADDADAVARPARWRGCAGVGHAGRRRAGPVVASVPALAPSLRAQPAGGDRRAGVHVDALPVVVLSADGRAGAPPDRGARGRGHDRRAALAGARRRGRRAVVDRPAQRGLPDAGRRTPRRGQPAGDAGVRGRAVASAACPSDSPALRDRPRPCCSPSPRRSASASRAGSRCTPARGCRTAPSSPPSAGPPSRSARRGWRWRGPSARSPGRRDGRRSAAAPGSRPARSAGTR